MSASQPRSVVPEDTPLTEFFRLPYEEQRRAELEYGPQLASGTLWSSTEQRELDAARRNLARLEARKKAADAFAEATAERRRRYADAVAKRKKAADDAAAAAEKRREDAAAALLLQQKRGGRRNNRQVIPDRVVQGRISKSFPTTLQKASRGMINPSQLCYRQAMLQGVLHTPEFYNLLGHVHKDCPKRTDECITCALQALAYAYWNETARDVEQYRNDLNKAMKKVFPNDLDVIQERQADPHEWIQAFVRHITKDHTGIDPDFPYDISKRLTPTFPTLDEIQDLFFFDYETRWRCAQCSRLWPSSRETTFGFPVVMRQDFDGTLLQHLDDEEASPFYQKGPYTCESDYCRSRAAMGFPKPESTKSWYITHAPEILVVHLNRYSGLAGANGSLIPGSNRKLTQRAAYEQILDLSLYADKAGKSIRYRLNAVISHGGNAPTSGHYVANVVCQNGAGYCQVNDSFVTRVQPGPNTLLAPDYGDPYLLIYSKITE